MHSPCSMHAPQPQAACFNVLNPSTPCPPTLPRTGAGRMPCSGASGPGSRPRRRSSGSSHTTALRLPWKCSGCSTICLRRSCLQGMWELAAVMEFEAL